MLPQKPRLEERVEEDDESADRHDQQPAGPRAVRQSGGDKISDGCCAHESRNCRHPNRLQEVGVEGCPIDDENPQRSKGGRPEAARAQQKTVARRSQCPETIVAMQATTNAVVAAITIQPYQNMGWPTPVGCLQKSRLPSTGAAD